MKERPILFSGPMVRAILEGRKTQTRRVIPTAHPKFPHYNQLWPDALTDGDLWYWDGVHEYVGASMPPKWALGDVLWVRESIKQRPMVNFLTGEPTNAIVAAYAADDADVVEENGFNLVPWWKNKGALPGIHMPRRVSRITLLVTDVRVERLHDISEEDAKAEGIKRSHHGAGDQWLDYPIGSSAAGWADPRNSFRSLWSSINGSDSWDANPWVYAITFDLLKQQSQSQIEEEPKVPMRSMQQVDQSA